MTHMRADWTVEAGGVTNTSPVTPDLIRGPAAPLVARERERDPRLRGRDVSWEKVE